MDKHVHEVQVRLATTSGQFKNSVPFAVQHARNLQLRAESQSLESTAMGWGGGGGVLSNSFSTDGRCRIGAMLGPAAFSTFISLHVLYLWWIVHM